MKLRAKFFIVFQNKNKKGLKITMRRRRNLSYDFHPLARASLIKQVNYDVWNIVRSYILKIWSGEIDDNAISVERVFSYVEPPGILGGVSLAGYDVFDNVIAEGKGLFAIVNYNGEDYIVSCVVNDNGFSSKGYFVSVAAEGEGIKVQVFLDELIKMSVKSSGYKGKILKIFYDEVSDGVKIKPVERTNITLDDIFIDDDVRADIKDFIDAVVNLSCDGMRYLFVGEPGTGKTDTMKAIINHCQDGNNQITVIISDAGCGVGPGAIFEFASIFSPVLVCIDDIDLMVGTREKGMIHKGLSNMLQILDGFVDIPGVFLIASTNDRELVDEAVRRPGRFDQIIEFGALEPRFYPEIVYRETQDQRFADVFKDDAVVEVLSNFGATGAFIVNLIKYLKRSRFEEKRYEPEFVIEVINRLRASFDILPAKFGF